MPVWVRTDAQRSRFSGLLMKALCSSHTNLISHPDMGPHIKNSVTQCGYKLLFILLQIMGHPRIQDDGHGETPAYPCQSPYNSIRAYTLKWIRFLRLLALHGRFVSDRGFIHKFRDNMHRSVKSTFESFFMNLTLGTGCANIPLDARLAPSRLQVSLFAEANRMVQAYVMDQPPNKRDTTAIIRELAADYGVGPPDDVYCRSVDNEGLTETPLTETQQAIHALGIP